MPSREADHSKLRDTRLKIAWGTSMFSKVATFANQAIAAPLVFTALGDSGFAAYASVTSAASVLGILSLGVGGSLVTPLAKASAIGDREGEALLVYAGLAPLFLLSLLVSVVAVPVAASVPLSILFGKASYMVPPTELRNATLIAVCSLLIAVPLSGFETIRQAYQEAHVLNILGAVANTVMCLLLVTASNRSASLTTFTIIYSVVPLLSRAANVAHLLYCRRYLLTVPRAWRVKDSINLLGDGIRYLSSSMSYMLLYQWPVYWIARTSSAEAASHFAISVQLALLPISFGLGLIQPFWSSTADAFTRLDFPWLSRRILVGRTCVLLLAISIIIVLASRGEQLVGMWLRRPVSLTLTVRVLIGFYIGLAMWEYFHFVIALGIGQLRKASKLIFNRCMLFALSVPLLDWYGGTTFIWTALCISILGWTAWRLPLLNASAVRSTRQQTI